MFCLPICSGYGDTLGTRASCEQGSRGHNIVSQGWRSPALAGDRDVKTDGLGVWNRRDENEGTAWTVWQYRGGTAGPNNQLVEPGDGGEAHLGRRATVCLTSDEVSVGGKAGEYEEWGRKYWGAFET